MWSKEKSIKQEVQGLESYHFSTNNWQEPRSMYCEDKWIQSCASILNLERDLHMLEMIHFLPLIPRSCLQSNYFACLDCRVSGFFLKLYFGCRMTWEEQVWHSQGASSHGRGWHVTEPGELGLSLASFLCSDILPWDHFPNSFPILGGGHRHG